MSREDLKNQKIEKWLQYTRNQRSNLVAGLDPAEFALGRGDKGMPNFNSKSKFYDWVTAYLAAIEPHCSAIKVNMKFFQNAGRLEVLDRVIYQWKEKFFMIADSKLADLDSSNEAELLSLSQIGFDAVTVAPYAGNLEGTTNDAAKYGLGVISMCLMSAPTYVHTKNNLVLIDSEKDTYNPLDLIKVENNTYVYKYIYDAYCISKYYALGAVIGAPSEKNGLSIQEINRALFYLSKKDDPSLILIPGWGAQGGGIEFVKEIGKYAMINQSRELMFPNGSNSTSHEQAKVAKKFAAEIMLAIN